MNVTAHDITLASLDAMEDVDSLCLFLSEDERPLKGLAGFVDWRLCGSLSRVLKNHFFVGAPEDTLLFPTEGRFPMPRIFAIGIGKSHGMTEAALGTILSGAAKVLSRAKVDGVALEIPGASSLSEEVRAAVFSRAFVPVFTGGRVAVLAEKTLRPLLPLSVKRAS